jgi:transposase-like protein
MALVAYAGKDTEPNPRQQYAYDRFMAGADTTQIAAFYRISEATVLRWVNVERSSQLGLPSPYGFRP